MTGGDGDDRLLGRSGDDRIDGNAGADVASLGSGTDDFTWDPGDGSDTVEGDSGSDAMVFNGSDAPEAFGVTADGSRARFTRSPGNITMDLDSLEAVRVNTLAGADTVTVDDLTGTDLDLLTFDTAGVVVNGTPGPDRLTASSPLPGTVRISGLGRRSSCPTTTLTAGSRSTDSAAPTRSRPASA